jgi:hypothetical protein
VNKVKECHTINPLLDDIKQGTITKWQAIRSLDNNKDKYGRDGYCFHAYDELTLRCDCYCDCMALIDAVSGTAATPDYPLAETSGKDKPMDWKEYGINNAKVLKPDGKTLNKTTPKEAFLIFYAEYPTEFPLEAETLENNFLRETTGKPYGKTYCVRVMTEIKQELKKQREKERKARPLLNYKK